MGPGSFPAGYPDLLKFWTRSALEKQKSPYRFHYLSHPPRPAGKTQHHDVLLQAGLFRNTSHCNAGTGIPQTTLGRALNTLLTPPNHPSHITAVHWFTASDDTSGELTRHGVCAVQVAGIWLSRR